MTKIDLQGKIYKWKTDLFENTYKTELSTEMKTGYDQALNDLLETIKEYRF
jgi:hypothetical protein